MNGICFLLAWLMDVCFGDPSRLPHPVVYMGKWISFFEHRLNKGICRMFKGALFAIFSITLTYLLFFALFAMLPVWATCVLHVVCVFFCLAGCTLRREVRMVFLALDRGLEEGRRQVARIVGRDTQQLTAQEVRTAALETLAENLSDGVVAPIFWYIVLGVPGMMAYKMVNTLDSMIGYQSPRYKDFGCWAAHIDDVANYLPARFTSFLLLLSGWLYSLLSPSSFLHHRRLSLVDSCRFVIHYGPKHASPNSGWPEAALACLLDCRFGGTHNYFGEEFYKPHIGNNSRSLSTTDMSLSINLCFMAECSLVIALVLVFWGL